MIILITGTPGSGKTLFAVAELLAGQFKERELLVNGIPQLLVPHTVISDEDVEAWHKGGVPGQDGAATFDVKGKVIVVDEVQRIARPRAASQRPPDWIAALETHRHKGVDFIIITQHPQLLDVNIRRLVGRHLHVRRTFALKAAVVYEWDHCENPGNVKQAATRLWRYPRAAFKLYKSSELHTKAGGRLPLVAYIAIVACLATPFLIWKSGSQLLGTFAQDKTLEKVGGNVPGNQAGTASNGQRDVKRPMTTAELVASLKPRLNGLEHTAPYYDQLTAPKRVPVPAACVQSQSQGCKCYTQDATPYAVEQSMCQDIVRGGIFLAFQEERRSDPQAGQAPARQADAAANSAPFTFIGAGERVPAAKPPVSDTPPPQARVRPGSPWSFQAGA